MRETLNKNPLVQVVILGALLVGVGFFLLSSMNRGGEDEASSETTVTATTPEGSVSVSVEGSAESATAPVAEPPPGALADAAPAPPSKVTRAFAADQTVVLLFVREGGIDDEMVADSVERLRALPGVTAVVEPANRVARYAAITQGVDVDRVPALVVLRPKRLDRGTPTASVSYGFQGPESVVQAVVDAGYKGPTVDYHP